MREVTRSELDAFVSARQTFALFLYTPFCGTCKLAARMLGIVQEMLPEVRLLQNNVNVAPDLAERWQVTSIPCLLWIKDGVISERLYAMNSVEHLYRFLKQQV
jgi:thiol-disulfide isomerase/thioredoxin